MSVIISIKDSLRQAVEAASGGQVTVMYDAKGYPCHMVRVPMFTLDTIDAAWPATPHPAFVVNGTTKSELWIGQYPAIVHDGVALALPGQDPAAYVNFDQADAYCTAKGSGWHMMTNAEWAAIALLSHKAMGADAIHGNTNYGRDYLATFETAPRQDGASPGLVSGAARTLTGAGPASWRHNGEPSGIADLVGNVWEWQRGMRLVDGEIQVIADNNAADNTISHAAGSSAWRAILQDGSLVAPGSAGTLKWDASGATGTGSPVLNTAITNQSDGTNSASQQWNAVTAAAGITVPDLAKWLAIYPHAIDITRGRIYIANQGERLPIRGGDWNGAAGAGVFALGLVNARSSSYIYIGFRPAFVL